ncbi:hypothetical protein [Alienimonas sp. DA493]|uniref:hypothetical protein n=1 Tax=Alienimonas sp. DA493 TaxID=3373605 RepID=UPI0037548DA1
MALLLNDPSALRFYTDIRAIFAALEPLPQRLDWLVTDLECNPLNGAPLPTELAGSDAQALTGEAFLRAVTEADLQFIWGVLSGFEPGTAPDPAALSVNERPYADGNPAFWTGCPAIQHPEAEIEIVCWDSCLSILLSRDPAVESRFRSAFPSAVDLETFNAARAAP